MKLENHAVLEKYAELIVRIGLNLRAGQRLMINAPIETVDLVRVITAQAYQAGARLVDVLWVDDQLNLIRFQVAPRDSFEEISEWRIKAAEDHFRRGDAYLSLLAQNPDLLKGQDAKFIGIATQARMKASMPLSDLVSHNVANWLVVSLPVESWAVKVFPELTPADAVSRLGEEIVRIVRLDQPDPVAAWRQHLGQLQARRDFMNERRFSALHFLGPGTDLTVGLPGGHVWEGGDSMAANGIRFAPNMPTEEIFTLPHRERVNGFVKASLPLSYSGQMIEDFGMTFRDGAVVECHATQGQELLRQLIAVDDGASRLGEVALVPASSPVAKAGRLFYNTLFDENAASHLAVGRAYASTLQGGESMKEEEFFAAGGNQSMTHVDFMIGSAQMNVDGILPDGSSQALMRQGEWTQGN